jgi:3-isopropylmalate dehydrogenase
MMLRHSLGNEEAATGIEAAVEKALEAGLRTADIWTEGAKPISTSELGTAVARDLATK